VEVAVVFPLLVFVALGLVQFALYYHAHNVVETAVMEAARTAAARGGSTGEGERRGNTLIEAGLRGRNLPRVHVEPEHANEDDWMVVASVHTTYSTFFPAFSFSNGITRLEVPLNAVARMSKEQFRDGR
jgi:hypothetical protein